MSERTVLTLKERVGLFFEDMKNAPLVGTPRGVYDLICRRLSALNHYAEIVNSGLICEYDHIEPITISPISIWFIEQKDPLVYSITTTGQILYVGQNGSFEFYSRGYENNESKLIMSKAGSDGRLLEQLFRRQLISA